MTRSTLVRAGGLAAIAGGTLRAAASFAPVVIDSDIERESLYIVVDVCLTIGLVGYSALHSKSIGWPGASGLALALAGLATVRANRAISAVDLYPAGALATACGVILLSARRASHAGFLAGFPWRSCCRRSPASPWTRPVKRSIFCSRPSEIQRRPNASSIRP